MATPRRTDQEVVQAILETPTLQQAARRLGYQIKYVAEVVAGRRRPGARRMLLAVSRSQLDQAHALLAKASGPAAARLLELLADEKVSAETRVSAARVVFGELHKREELAARYAEMRLTAAYAQSLVARITGAFDKVLGSRMTRDDRLRLADELQQAVSEDEPRVPFRRVAALTYARTGGDGDGRYGPRDDT